jgi:hypothetical protein
LTVRADCGANRMRSVSRVSYDADGKPLEQQDDPLPWQSVIPDSPGELLYTGACSLVAR